ncbi:hypothetical protein EV702DRAFT_1182290 [Suillus placidus]|uniref:Uncharacterized protein n=1 Tax=Suillus placidus TaxID=48579 RepID=A0A9P6ZHR2_9AGAM|nr:hypothetical protein EV702DRAFT_1182290 [Suillus placidus]
MKILTGYHTLNASLLRASVAILRERNAPTAFQQWNQVLSPVAKKQVVELAADIKHKFHLSGIKLQNGNQRLFYLAIRKFKPKPHQRRSTRMNLAKTQYAVNELSSHTPTPPQIWNSIRNRDIPKSIRGFLWESIHNAYKIGNFWEKIPNYENRGKPLAKLRESSWPHIKFGTILGCNLATFRDEKGKKKEGMRCLFTILILESAHLIWKIRCERVIKIGDNRELHHSDKEIYNRWLKSINNRLKLDRLLTNTTRFGTKATSIDTVLKTWSGILLNEENLPDNWIRQSGVLVGMAPYRPLGRNR